MPLLDGLDPAEDQSFLPKKRGQLAVVTNHQESIK